MQISPVSFKGTTGTNGVNIHTGVRTTRPTYSLVFSPKDYALKPETQFKTVGDTFEIHGSSDLPIDLDIIDSFKQFNKETQERVTDFNNEALLIQEAMIKKAHEMRELYEQGNNTNRRTVDKNNMCEYDENEKVVRKCLFPNQDLTQITEYHKDGKHDTYTYEYDSDPTTSRPVRFMQGCTFDKETKESTADRIIILNLYGRTELYTNYKKDKDGNVSYDEHIEIRDNKLHYRRKGVSTVAGKRHIEQEIEYLNDENLKYREDVDRKDDIMHQADKQLLVCKGQVLKYMEGYKKGETQYPEGYLVRRNGEWRQVKDIEE